MAERILFVDDDPHWRMMVSTCLRDAGYQVLAVKDASEALLQSGEDRLALIILDLDLGGENGLMLMKFLKRSHPWVPILLYTGMQHDEEAVQRMREQGAQQYVRKGNLDDLIKAVKGILG
jgi:two-component system response regulator HydG